MEVSIRPETFEAFGISGRLERPLEASLSTFDLTQEQPALTNTRPPHRYHSWVDRDSPVYRRNLFGNNEHPIDYAHVRH